MYFVFEFPRDKSVTELEKKIEKINSFLKKRVNHLNVHRCFGIRLLPPVSTKHSNFFKSKNHLEKIQHPQHYLLVFQFFNDASEEVGNLRIVIDLGENPENLSKLDNDISSLSYLTSFSLSDAIFTLTENSLSVKVTFDDNNPNCMKVKIHIEYVVPGNPIPDCFSNSNWFSENGGQE